MNVAKNKNGNPYLNWEEGVISITKNTKNNGVLGFGLVNKDIAKEIIVNNHYSKKWNTQFGLINIGVYKESELLGVASFGRMMNPKSYKKIVDSENIDSVLELNRLWIDDQLGKNTETILVSMSMKYIKNNHPHVLAIQSFADGRLGCGTIYKASNFKYYGFKKSIFFENIKTGEIFHKVPLENTKRPTGFKRLNLMYIKGELKPLEVKTYRYIYPLQKNVQIKLKEKPYPEYEKGYEYISYKPTCNQIFKLWYILQAQSDHENLETVTIYLRQNYEESELIKSNENAKKYFQKNHDILGRASRL